MKKKRIFLLLVCMFSVSAFRANAQSTAMCWVYQIEASGYTNYQNAHVEFQQAGYLGVTGAGLTNSSNVGDISIIMGRPVTSPSDGALSFTSNTYFIGSLSHVVRSGALELAQVDMQSTSRGTVTLVATIPDNFTSNFGINQGLIANTIDWGSGVTAGAETVVAGSVSAEFSSDGSVNGVIDLGARNWTSYTTDISYHAEFSGTLAGSYNSIDSCVITNR
jgi:hypothetical protein